jgi:Na+-transporting NADH:ubiquinone oxidoreductase subunit F
MGLAPLLVPMTVFTTLVALLALAVLMVRTRLTAREPVTVVVNERRSLSVLSGATLLDTLAANGIALPAACGGRGACGQCRVRIAGEPGELLPTELNHINRANAAAGMRLACMVKVRQDLQVWVPEAILEAQRCVCTVHSNENVSTYLKHLVLNVPAGETFEFTAGDYVLLQAPAGTVEFATFDIGPEYRNEWRRAGLLERTLTLPEPMVRAYSLGNAPDLSAQLSLVVRIALAPPGAAPEVPPGMVSSFLFGLKPGDEVTVIGPYGEFHAREGVNEMVFVGGGAGIAPLRAIIQDQLRRGATRKMSLWYGSRNLRELCFYDEFQRLAEEHPNFAYHVALSGPDIEPEWQGATGLIHTVLYEQYLSTHTSPESADYYLCGPPLMSAATLAVLEDLGVDRERVLFDDFGATPLPGD